MSTPSDFHFFEDGIRILDTALTTYVGDVAANIIGAISGVAYSLLMIYMMLWGWTMLRGMISEPVTDGTARIIRLAVIVGLALKIGLYNTYIADFLWNSPDAMARVVASGSSSQGNIQYLDGLMSQIYDLGDAYWQKSHASTRVIPDLGLMAIALLVWSAGVAATVYGAFLLALAKMALAILLGLGPIFLLFLIFEGTKRLFDVWLGQALNFVFLVLLTAAAIKLILAIVAAYLRVTATVAAANPTIDLALPCIVFCIIGALVMMQLPALASALGGGVAISTLGAAGWAFGKTQGAFAAMRPTSLRRSYNKAASDVRIARNAAGTVAKAPMAVYRKITGGSKNKIKSGS